MSWRALNMNDAAAAPDAQLTHREVLVVMSGLMLGMLVAALGQTVVATALPTIVGELGGQDQLAWVVSATLLTSTASTPLWGKMSDLYGRRPLFQAAIVVFLVGSVLCGLSQTMGQLIGFRAVQGLGIGGLMALSQAIIGDIVSPRERGRYQGYIGSVFGVSSVGGPLIGGFLVDGPGWRWCFYVGVPIGIAAYVVTNRVLTMPFARRDHQIDYLGAALIVGGVSLLLLLLSLGGSEFEWGSTEIAGMAVGSAVLLTLAVVQERRAAEPIIPPRLFRIPTFRITSLAGFIVGVAMFGAIVYLPQYLQIVKGQSPTRSGLLTIPLMIGLMGMSIGSGRVITRTGRYKVFPVVGLIVVAIGLSLFSLLGVDTPLPVAGAYMLVLGAGLGMVMQVLVLAVQNAVEHRDLGTATSAATFFRSMGGALGVAVFGALLSNRLGRYIPERLAAAGVEDRAGGGDLLGTPDAIAALPGPVRDAVLGGFADSLSDIYTIAIPIALVGFVVVLFLPELPLRTSVRDQEPVVTDGEAVSAAFETSFVDDNADVPDLTESGVQAFDRQTDATGNP
ncbi:DHA2 family efflux MFS transporter permease subunit [Actinomarinicola tropica]|uniref:DHA2 family efflux MFS transporter permease subunit n=2 Tax=Actinomarinicola tropica TaxID=2789776 RepID=A0A5Q2RB18_9ACTN|nr:DHA2 family efflux MFS transporter permease subunit [Actinomarinicola tropica]